MHPLLKPVSKYKKSWQFVSLTFCISVSDNKEGKMSELQNKNIILVIQVKKELTRSNTVIFWLYFRVTIKPNELQGLLSTIYIYIYIYKNDIIYKLFKDKQDYITNIYL